MCVEGERELPSLSQVAEIIIMREKVTEKPRGFGFAILDNFDDVERLCSKKYIKIKVGPNHVMIM